MHKEKHTILILHNIRSAHNVGSIFRTADAAGVSKIYLTGYTPTPLDRFGRPQKEIAKTALGAEQTLPWKQYKNIGTLMRMLKRDGYFLIAVEQSQDSVHYSAVRTHAKTAFLVGNEVRGISKQLLAQCDVVAEIPMRGKKESLNVGVATGVALFGILKPR